MKQALCLHCFSERKHLNNKGTITTILQIQVQYSGIYSFAKSPLFIFFAITIDFIVRFQLLKPGQSQNQHSNSDKYRPQRFESEKSCCDSAYSRDKSENRRYATKRGCDRGRNPRANPIFVFNAFNFHLNSLYLINRFKPSATLCV